MLPYLLPLAVLADSVTARPLENITLPLPEGTSNHGTPGLLCTPTKWTDVVMFLLFNYVAHAATVLTRPGERSDDFIVSVIGSLLFPAIGLYRGIEAIFSGAVFVRKDDLRKAARSGALCMVVRGRDWRPADGDKVTNAVYKRGKNAERESLVMVPDGATNLAYWKNTSETEAEPAAHVITYSPPWMNSKFGCPVYVHRQIVHGTYDLPEGYRFAIVPSDANFTAPSGPNAIIEVSATYNLVKALIALVQSGYALSTLYRSRGDQIKQFGYAAFGLTVAPYAVMSIVNLIGNLCRPEYPSLYMVENSIMQEARNRGASFSGSVATIQEDTAAVCGCGLGDGNDAEQLRFSSSSDGGELVAHFGTTTPPGLYASSRSTSMEAEKHETAHEPLTRHTLPIRPLPSKLDWTGTDDDALLVLPCCNPIQRRSSPQPPFDVPLRHRIAALLLRKVCPPFKQRIWIPYFRASTPPTTRWTTLHWQLTKFIITLTIALIPLAITGAMSRFQQGSLPSSTTSTWRAYTVQWPIFGAVCGVWWVFDHEQKAASPSAKMQIGPVVRALLYVTSGSSAVGGYVVVAQMLSMYGMCVWVGD